MRDLASLGIVVLVLLSTACSPSTLAPSPLSASAPLVSDAQPLIQPLIQPSSSLALPSTGSGLWTLIQSPPGTVGPITIVNGANVAPWIWATPPPGASWIGVNDDDARLVPPSPQDPAGLYIYRLTFIVERLPATLTGQWAADNSPRSRIWLNGVETPVVVSDPLGFTVLSPFTVSTGLVVGDNTLDVHVMNEEPRLETEPNPTGLLMTLDLVSRQCGGPPAPGSNNGRNTDEQDGNCGHGNDADRWDEDNPGRKRP